VTPPDLQFDASLVKRSHVLVTGASGFVGSHLCRELLALGVETYGMVRATHSVVAPDVAPRLAADLLDSPAVVRAVAGMDAVVHLAARTHVMRDRALDPLAEFRRVNVGGTLNLARLAAAAGVRRFVFISSIKVNGDHTLLGRPYTADDLPAPADPYGTSKYEAEVGLRKIADDTGIQLVIIRPVLVYGPGVKANFLAMMRWVSRGVPLPLGAIHNKRSLIASANLVDLIITCLGHHAAVGQTFLVSDGEDLSTTTLLRRMAKALDRPARLIPVPASLLSVGAKIARKEAWALRLCGSLQVDICKTTDLLGWRPPLSVDQALLQTAEHYLNQRLVRRSSPNQASAVSQ
jgi:nucleoside-diphosphate-sugar epimerase